MSELPMQKEYEGSVCEIKSMDNRLIAIGRIKEVNAENIKISNSKKELMIVDYGTPIKINVFNAKIGFRVLVGTIYTSTRMEMTIDSIYNLVERERRNFFRVDMNTPATIFYKEKPDEEELPVEKDVVIMDMSLSGLKIRTECDLGENRMFSVELDLNSKKKSIFQCRVLRLIDYKNKKYYYGCEFVYSKSDDADLLCSFLFRKQREFLNQRDSLL